MHPRIERRDRRAVRGELLKDEPQLVLASRRRRGRVEVAERGSRRMDPHPQIFVGRRAISADRRGSRARNRDLLVDRLRQQRPPASRRVRAEVCGGGIGRCAQRKHHRNVAHRHRTQKHRRARLSRRRRRIRPGPGPPQGRRSHRRRSRRSHDRPRRLCPLGRLLPLLRFRRNPPSRRPRGRLDCHLLTSCTTNRARRQQCRLLSILGRCFEWGSGEAGSCGAELATDAPAAEHAFQARTRPAATLRGARGRAA